MVLELLIAAQVSAGVVLPVYRDLLQPRPFVDATYGARCGFGTGPTPILSANTTADDRAAIVRGLDAANVVQLAERSLARAAKVLPGATVTICLYPGDLAGALTYLDGVGGVSLGAGHIKLLLHPQPDGLRRVTYTVAHEYHHEVDRLQGPGGNDPLDIMLREGRADYFATSLYPELKPPHTKPLSAAELRQSWTQLLDFQQRRALPNEFRAAFMIGSNPRVLVWPGYRLGYEMTELYFKAHPAAPQAAMRVSSQAIFDHYSRYGRITKLIR